MDPAEAASLLAQAAATDAAAGINPAEGNVAPSTEQVAQPSTPEVEPGATPEGDSFLRSLDPNSLPDEVTPFYKSMQADYTRGKQEIAPWRKLGEELGISPDEAREAVQFVTALQSDPNVAKQVYQELASIVGETPAVAEDVWNDDDELGVDPEIARMRQEFDQMKTWQQTQERQYQEQQLAMELQRQESTIRQQHPELNDSDMDAVYQLAVAHNGNLMEAYNAYDGMRNTLISRYLQQKEQVPRTTPASTGPAQEAARPLSFDEAHQQALERYRAAANSE